MKFIIGTRFSKRTKSQQDCGTGVLSFAFVSEHVIAEMCIPKILRSAKPMKITSSKSIFTSVYGARPSDFIRNLNDKRCDLVEFVRLDREQLKISF